MQDPKALIVWQKSHALTLRVYAITQLFPKEELYGMISQMRRSAASIPTNIAEGCGRDGQTDFARFLQIAMGSACELEYQLLLSHDLKYMTDADFVKLNSSVSEVKQMLASFIKKVRSSSVKLNTGD